MKNLFRHLESAGRMKLLPGILRELRRREAHEAKLAPVLEVASESEVSAARAAGAQAEAVVVNESLISGWRERSAGTLRDRSGKTALVEIYRNIIRK